MMKSWDETTIDAVSARNDFSGVADIDGSSSAFRSLHFVGVEGIDERGVLEWLNRFEAFVNGLDFEGGRRMFDPDCVCFGSKAEVLTGLDDLVERQWKAIWPNITDFRFLLEALHLRLSPDSLAACVVVPWTSTGYDRSGDPFARPGRSTLLLEKRAVSDAWIATHSHYSLHPGTHAETYGSHAGSAE